MESYELTLHPSEVMFARSIAALRTGINRINNVVNPKFKESDDFQNDLLGVCGEMVFAKRFNVYMDLTFKPRSGGHDFTMNSGKTVDVKTTDRDQGRLIVPEWKAKKGKSDIYVLVTGQIPTFTIRGYATADEVFNSVIDLGYGPCFGLQQDQLHDFRN